MSDPRPLGEYAPADLVRELMDRHVLLPSPLVRSGQHGPWWMDRYTENEIQLEDEEAGRG